MYDYLPLYRRGQSIPGYVIYCSAGKLLQEAVPNITARREICRNHAQQAQIYLSQPA